MVGLVKKALHKTIGNGLLSWKELEEVLLDVEVCLNDRPHLYPFELSVDIPKMYPLSDLNAGAREFRPKRQEAIAARERIRQTMQECKMKNFKLEL
jgi:hypothetical protein